MIAGWPGLCSPVVAMSQSRVALGKIGEDLACRELERRGYAILARRYRRRGGELDIVARDGPAIVFVEVKARESLDYGAGGEAVTALKRRRMAAVAMDYLARHRLTERPCRFDVVALDLRGEEPVIEVYRNAFDVC
jgi:putative endonuclease